MKTCKRCKKNKSLSCFIGINKELKTCSKCREKDLSYNRKKCDYKEYYKNNKNKIQVKNSKKVKCECGSEVTKSSYHMHCRSMFHHRYLRDIGRIDILKKHIKKKYLACIYCLQETDCNC